MPQLIKHIDKIAREKQRDVLFIRFGGAALAEFEDVDVEEKTAGGFENEDEMTNILIRQSIIDWLEAHGFAWEPCGLVANTSMMQSFDGSIYIDVPFDAEDSQYRVLRDFLEKPDGKMAHPEVVFCYYPLLDAMKNAHHDAPGFWEN